MSFLIYLIIFSLYPFYSTSSSTYGLIRNAIIEIPFDISPEHGYKKLEEKSCDPCLCDAFSKPNVMLFTCTENQPENFTCQFYYFMPKRDEIKLRNYTKIYLIRNETFEEKDDCCNTTYLLEKMNAAKSNSETFIKKSLRFLSRDNNAAIFTITIDSQLYKFNISTLQRNLTIILSGFQTVGYYDKKYYLGKNRLLSVYNETLNLLMEDYAISQNTDDTITSIRFLNDKQMLVGTSKTGVYICDKDGDIFKKCDVFSKISNGSGHVNAFGIVNDSAFYVGWDKNKGNELQLYTKDGNQTWSLDPDHTIRSSEEALDIDIDNCGRIWTVVDNNKIIIYDKNTTRLGDISLVGPGLNNLLIFDNYTLFTSHYDPGIGLARIQPASVNGCEQLYTSNFCIENDDWRPTQDVLLTRFAEVEYCDMFRTINQDYGSFYYDQPASPCVPDTLKEKLYKRHDRFMQWLMTQTASCQNQNQCARNIFPQCNTQTVTITHRKRFPACNIDESIIDFLVKQIQQRLEGLIDPSDYDDVFKCARLLIIDLLKKEPSLCAEDVINRVIAIMNTPFCNANVNLNFPCDTFIF